MVDFASRLSQGLSAHEEAVREANEIKQVVRDLDEQVFLATDRIIHIGIENFRVRKQAKRDTTVGSFAAAAMGIMDLTVPEYEEFKGIGAKADGVSKEPVLLARWETTSRGYPVTITYFDVRTQAYDKESLEKALGDLLASPETGGAIHRLIIRKNEENPKIDE